MATYKHAAALENVRISVVSTPMDEEGFERLKAISMLIEGVKGIGRKAADAFYDMGVRSPADLHQYLTQHSDEEIRSALRERGAQVVPHSAIEKYDWRGQAERLAAQAKAADPPPLETHSPGEKEDDVLPTDPSVPEHDAAFNVFFDRVTAENGAHVLQTTVYEDRDFGDERVFTGTETAPWVNWILERAGLPIPEKAESAQPALAEDEETEPRAPRTDEETRIEIHDVQTSEVGPSSGVPEKRLAAEIHFQIVGPQAETIVADRIPFRVEVHAVDVESKHSSLLASGRSELQPDVHEYVSWQEFRFPPLGRYELHTMVLLLPPGAITAYHQGPTIRIVA